MRRSRSSPDPVPAPGAHLEQGRPAGRGPGCASRRRRIDACSGCAERHQSVDALLAVVAQRVGDQRVEVLLHLSLDPGAPGLHHRLVDEAEPVVAGQVGDRLQVALGGGGQAVVAVAGRAVHQRQDPLTEAQPPLEDAGHDRGQLGQPRLGAEQPDDRGLQLRVAMTGR